MSVSKTFSGTMDEALAAWQALINDISAFNGVAPSKPPKISKTDRWRHWTCSLEDGTRIALDTWEKAPGKAGIALVHTKLPSQEAKEAWHLYWKGLIGHLPKQ